MKRFPSFLCFLMAAAISASLTGCGGSPGAGSSAQGQSADPPAQSAQPEAGTPAADPSGAPDHNVPGEGPAGAVPEGEPSTLSGGSEQGQNVPNSPEDKPAHVGESGESSYDFSQPAPESPAVDNTYFEDAAFVGDSRTDGFLLYSGIGTRTNLTSNGLSIFKLAEKKVITIDGTAYTLLEALELGEYGKVYLSLGVNELGYYNDEGFYQAYCDAIDAIRACQPDAVIYIQGLIPLNESVVAASGGPSYLTNEHLRVYNGLMQKAAEEKQVVFLDLYSEFANENGELPEEASKDGVHLKSDYCKQWLEYLKVHTVDFETLYPEGTET